MSDVVILLYFLKQQIRDILYIQLIREFYLAIKIKKNMNIIIKGTNFDITLERRKFIEEKINAVEKFHPKISEIRVEIECDHLRKKGDIYRMEVNVCIPGKLIRVEKYTNDFAKSVNKVKNHLKVVLNKERKKVISKGRR